MRQRRGGVNDSLQPSGPRRSIDLLAAAIEPADGFVVAIYAVAMLPHEPRHTLSELRAFASSQDWRVYGRAFWDCDRSTRPIDRAGWRQVEHLTTGGFIQGVVTFSAAEVSTDVAEYEAVRDRFEFRRTFLAHVPDDWRRAQPDSGSAG
ncbi:hypothetical protein ACF1DY_31885 [Streptomyces albus]|uniref:hypothetical protein n=1 Tax=Streptomyces albus TaxID=1888 RepID=UPI0037007BBE